MGLGDNGVRAKGFPLATKTIGLIGAGHIGSQIARLAIARGYAVVISNSRGPETLAGLVAELGPVARAATATDAASAGDIVVVTVPLRNYRQVPVAPLAGKIVIDTNNYYPQRDGHIPELDNESTTTVRTPAGAPADVESRQGVQPYSRGATDHRRAAGGIEEPPRAGHRRRRPCGKATVEGLIDQFGFDTVDAGRSRKDGASSATRPATAHVGRPMNSDGISRRPGDTPTDSQERQAVDLAGRDTVA